jgi:hypothetical protein
MVKRGTWLSVTPEPERELPQAVVTLAEGHRPGGDAVERERAKIEQLVLNGSQEQWLRYLHGVVELVTRSGGSEDPDVEQARERATAVIYNHHNLLLAHPGRSAIITADDRETLRRVQQDGE